MTQPVGHGKNVFGQKIAGNRGSTAPDVCSTGSHSAPTSSVLTEAVRLGVGDQNYLHWFKDRSHLEATGSQLVVHVANPFICSWIIKRFRQQLSKAAVDVLGPSAECVVHVDASISDRSSRAKTTEQSGDTSYPTQNQTSNATAECQNVAPLSDFEQRYQDEPTKLAVRPPARRRFRSFNSLVSGPCNELPIMAARQISEAPGERFNPLYLHGTTGVGKSHLLEAIYGAIRKSRPELNVLFLTSESFTNYFTSALAERSVPSFRQRFRSVDVLLVDNIEFLGNKKATQEEFLHTIDQLTNHGGQLVITGDRHPRLLTKHREELTTRFIGGLVCRIDTPAVCTRRKLVQSLAVPHRELLSSGALSYVASHGGRNARELQGSVNCLVSYAALHGSRVTTSHARRLLGGLKDECRHLVRINDVERIVCEAFGVSVLDIRSKTRRKAISCPRSIAMYVARKLTKAAWREIGQYFGGRDHSTVVAAAKRVDEWISERAQ
ncbi:MAG: chromosomal replication initiator protein DnaA, partial [Fuerstiella sp.]|nr:chromosomal replication initiator protein DnaA [Fuerstiella sp.]